VDVTQIITDFGRSINLSASSKLHAHAQAQAAVATRAEILLALDAAYFDALSAQSVLQVARQTVATRQFTDDQIKELATNKLRSALDVSFADVNLGEARLLLAGAQKDLESAFERLSNLLGERERRSYALMDQPTNGLPAEDDVELVQTALRNRPDVMQLRYERDAAEKFARAEQGLNYPTISAVGSAGILPVHDPVMRNNYAAAGVNLSLPIFDGFLFSARKEGADLKARAAAEEVRNIEDNVIRDVRVALLNLKYAAARMTLTEQLLASARESLELANARYKVGSSSIVELSQAQLNETQAQIEQARARYDYQTRQAILRFQIGDLR